MHVGTFALEKSYPRHGTSLISTTILSDGFSSQSKDGENNDTSSPARSRTSSSDPQGGYDRAVAVEAEGFLCPACMEAFLTPEDLMAHYEVCKIRLENAAALEDHMAQNYSPRDNEMVTALSEERWRSEELRKEVAMLQEQLTSKSASEESRMYQQQLRALQEAKSLRECLPTAWSFDL